MACRGQQHASDAWGAKQVYMRQIDVAGNIGDSTNIFFIYLWHASGIASVVAQTTTLTSPTISGTFSAPPKAGDILTVSVAGQTIRHHRLRVQHLGRCRLLATAVGTHSVTATMSDAAGNSRTDVSVSELVILSLTPDSDTCLITYVQIIAIRQAIAALIRRSISNTSRSNGGFLYNTIDFETPKSLYAPSWSWAHRPDFVVLPPVVTSFRGIVANITGINLNMDRFAVPYSAVPDSARASSIASGMGFFGMKYAFTNIDNIDMKLWWKNSALKTKCRNYWKILISSNNLRVVQQWINPDLWRSSLFIVDWPSLFSEEAANYQG